MIQETETADSMIKMKARNFFSMLAVVIVTTNSVSFIYQKVLRNEEQREYDRERSNRVAENKMKEAKDYHDKKALETELYNCKNNN